MRHRRRSAWADYFQSRIGEYKAKKKVYSLLFFLNPKKKATFSRGFRLMPVLSE